MEFGIFSAIVRLVSVLFMTVLEVLFALVVTGVLIYVAFGVAIMIWDIIHPTSCSKFTRKIRSIFKK